MSYPFPSRHFAPQSKPGLVAQIFLYFPCCNVPPSVAYFGHGLNDWPIKPMKHRIPPKFHGPLCLLGFLAIIAIVALIESIGGLQ
jgi:hypothetical protein